jgi:hypothetical protein
MFSMATYRGFWELYLNVVNYIVVAKLSLCTISCRGKAVGCDVEEGAIAGICDVDCTDRDW